MTLRHYDIFIFIENEIYSLIDGSILITGWRARALIITAWSLSALFSVPMIFLYEEKRIQVCVYIFLTKIYELKNLRCFC